MKNVKIDNKKYLEVKNKLCMLIVNARPSHAFVVTNFHDILKNLSEDFPEMINEAVQRLHQLNIQIQLTNTLRRRVEDQGGLFPDSRQEALDKMEDILQNIYKSKREPKLYSSTINKGRAEEEYFYNVVFNGGELKIGFLNKKNPAQDWRLIPQEVKNGKN